jgi:hypothetical protein
MAEQRGFIRSVDKKVSGAFGAAGKWAGRALGNLIAPVLGGAAAGAIGDALGRLLYRIDQFWLAALAANFILTLIPVAVLVVFTAFALFVINSGAYIVPPSAGSLGAGGTGASATELCFNFVNFPENALQTELAAVNIIAQAESYVQELCNRGTVTIRYNPVQPSSNLGGRAPSAGTIIIYPNGTGSLGNTLYTLAHELGHIHQYRTGADQTYYESSALAAEGGVCTYPVDMDPNTPGKQVTPGESYAEMIALYIGGPNPPSGFAVSANGDQRLNCLGGNFKTGMPLTWQFAHDSIFFENLEW